MRTIVIVVASVIALVVTWCCVGPRRGSQPTMPEMDPQTVASVLADLDALAACDPRSARANVGDAATVAVHVEMDDAALLGLLRAAGRAWNAGDTQALSSPLEALLSSPSPPRRVLAMLEQARLGNRSLEEQGAILTIGFGLAHASRGGALSLEGRPLAQDVLDSLTRIEREPGVGVAQFASSLRVGGELAVGARWITTIVTLRERAPAHAENFDPFLRAILDGSSPIDLPEDDLAALSLIVSTSNDPLAVEAALAALIASDPVVFIPIAEDLFAHSAANPALRSAALGAIAARAPLDAAAESLARLADSKLYAEFARLGSRPGALEAVQQKYSALLASNSDPEARKMLVSAMGPEKTAVLVGIAETDPDADVRHQALLTASLQPLESETVMRTVRDQLAARGSAGTGMSTHAGLMVAENVILNGSGTARAEAVGLLRQVVIDPSESMSDRKDAWSMLHENGEPIDVAGLDEPR